MSLSKYSIPTEYKGITFRSRLEAQWGLLLGVSLYTVIHIRNLAKWKRSS